MRYLIALAVALAIPVFATATIKSDIPTPVQLSNIEPNRILCPQGTHVSQVVFAQDKPLTVQYQTTQAFLQFKQMVITDELGSEIERKTYGEKTDIYAICGDDVYHLIVTPASIRGATIRLGDPELQNIRNTLADFRQLDIVDRAQHIVERAYTENLPTSWQVWNERKEPLTQFDQISALHRRTIEAPGTGLKLLEYIIIGKQDNVVLSERDFIHAIFTDHPFFISLANHQLRKGEQTRLFIVERVR